jgi:mersacidin/lichenicidin family type 2 lantibiotic
MPNEDIIRAWKDENYFHDLSAEARANIPNNPAGELQELSSEEMSQVIGAANAASKNAMPGYYGYGGTSPTFDFAGGQKTVYCHQQSTLDLNCQQPRMTQFDFCASVFTQRTTCDHTFRCVSPTVKHFCNRF